MVSWGRNTRFFYKKVEISVIYREILYKFVFFPNFPYKLSARLYILSYIRLSLKKACKLSKKQKRNKAGHEKGKSKFSQCLGDLAYFSLFS